MVPVFWSLVSAAFGVVFVLAGRADLGAYVGAMAAWVVAMEIWHNTK